MVVLPMRTHNTPRHHGEPLNPLTTSHGGGHGLVELPLLVDGGKGQATAVPVDGPHPAVTASGSQFLVTLRRHDRPYLPFEPVPSITADGNHHGVVDAGLMVRMNGDEADAKSMATPWTDPAGTVTGAANQAIVPFLAHYHRTGGASSTTEPSPTMTTHDRCGVVEPASVSIDDCGFRMMEPHEAGAAMAFPDSYTVEGSKRTRVKLYGQAVTPPVSAEISARAIESLAG